MVISDIYFRRRYVDFRYRWYWSYCLVGSSAIHSVNEFVAKGNLSLSLNAATRFYFWSFSRHQDAFTVPCPDFLFACNTVWIELWSRVRQPPAASGGLLGTVVLHGQIMHLQLYIYPVTQSECPI